MCKCFVLVPPCHILGSRGAVRVHISFACRMKPVHLERLVGNLLLTD